jgi:hypothetical protein
MNEALKQSLNLHTRLTQVDWLVNLAENTLKNNQPPSEKSQLAAFLGVANETRSARVVVNWVQYQMGRGGPPQRFWKDSKLGDQVKADIEGEIRQNAEATAAQVYGPRPTEEQKSEVYIRLIRLYAGYLRRWLVALPPRRQEYHQGNRR